ncbi:MAG: hypothetical protein IPN86_22195 [Saprospiraceae bacterium]|nr:hypothetical protein [Saprospiraceae bacterium]
MALINQKKIKSSGLKEIGLYDSESNETFIYKKYKAAGYAFGKKPKVYKDPIWAYEIHATERVIAYLSPSAEVSHGEEISGRGKYFTVT